MENPSKSWENILDGPIYTASRDNLDPFKFFENICYQNLIHDMALSPSFSPDSLKEMELFKGISKESFSLEDEVTEDDSLAEDSIEGQSESRHREFLIDDLLNSSKKIRKMKILVIKADFDVFLEGKDASDISRRLYL